MKNPDHISKSHFLGVNPGWEKLGSGIRDKNPGSATLENTSTVQKKHEKNHLKISIVVDHVGLQLLQHVLYQKATRFHRIIIH